MLLTNRNAVFDNSAGLSDHIQFYPIGETGFERTPIIARSRLPKHPQQHWPARTLSERQAVRRGFRRRNFHMGTIIYDPCSKKNVDSDSLTLEQIREIGLAQLAAEDPKAAEEMEIAARENARLGIPGDSRIPNAPNTEPKDSVERATAAAGSSVVVTMRFPRHRIA